MIRGRDRGMCTTPPPRRPSFPAVSCAAPRVRLPDGGKPNDILIEIISQNVRVPEQGLGDIWAQVSGCRTMSERLQSLLETVNLDALGAEVRLRSENAMRAAIREIPDGVYRSTVQHDGFDEPILIKCELT